jgi:hypothetical protein
MSVNLIMPSILKLISKLFILGLNVFSIAIAVESKSILDNFNTTTVWSYGSQNGGKTIISSSTTENYLNSRGSLKANYPIASGGVYNWASLNISSWKTNSIKVSFWAKMPKAKHGFKFLKIFSGRNAGYANTTFGLNYTGGDNGSMYQVSFGDGTNIENDTANVINFDGSYPEWIGRSFGVAAVSTPKNQSWSSSNWGTDWHHFVFTVRFNSGTTKENEIADGEYYVEIDGVVYVQATGLFNRHYSNLNIDRVELLGWSQSGSEAFEIWYDDVKVEQYPLNAQVENKQVCCPSGNVIKLIKMSPPKAN